MSNTQDPYEAYKKGWLAAARWANRDDLVADIGSMAYNADMYAALQPAAAQPQVDDPCPGCVKGGVCRTPKCGRLTLPVDHPFRSGPQANEPSAKWSIGDLAGAVDAANRDLHKTIASLCEQIRYMVGIAERGTGEKCPDNERPEVFLLNYVKSLEAAPAPPEGGKRAPLEPTEEMIDAANEVLCTERSWIFHAYRAMLAAAPARAVEPLTPDEDKDKDKALDLLETLFDAYEDGVPCYEDGDPDSAFIGHAFQLDDETFHACADLLNRRRPRAHSIPATTPTKTQENDK